MKFIFLFSLLLANSKADAKTLQYAPTTSMQSETEMSLLEMNCTGEKPFETFNCEFVQKSIRTSTDDIKKTKEQFAKVKKEEITKLETDMAEVCKKLKTYKQEQSGVSSIVEAQSVQLNNLNDFCACSKKEKIFECFKVLSLKEAEIKEKTCRFASNTFKMEFKKISENKWMNVPEPKGLCNVVNAITLEFDGDYKWKYTQTRISADKGDLCAFEINKPVFYSSGASLHKVKCEYIDIGPSI